MRVGILTFHNAYNYGAVLQTYATQELVKSMGHEVEIIDYHNARIDRMYDKRKFHLKEFFKSTYKFPLYLLEKYFFWRRRLAYNKFNKNCLQCSRNKYYQGDVISIKDYDAVLIGSDQVWNKRLTGGLDAVYWGNFESSSFTRIVAWSVCMNNMDFTESELKEIKNYLSNFTAISVREEALQGFISKLIGKRVLHTLDPTFLLPSTKWELLCHPVKEDDYIAVYAIRKADETINFARKISSALNKKLIIIRPYSRWYFSCENKEYCGPNDFLSYIKNASYVVTSSFHGTVFSLIFKRQFFCPALDVNLRVEDLLKTVGLSDRFVRGWEDALSLSPINYDTLPAALEVKKNETLSFLSNALG